MSGGIIAIALTVGFVGLLLVFGDPARRFWWHMVHGSKPPTVTPEPSVLRKTAIQAGHGTTILLSMILLLLTVGVDRLDFTWVFLIPPIVGLAISVVLWTSMHEFIECNESDECCDTSDNEIVPDDAPDGFKMVSLSNSEEYTDEAFPDEDENPGIEW